MVVMNRREYRHLYEEYTNDDGFNSREHLPHIVKRLAGLIPDQRTRLFVVTCDTDGASAVMHTSGNIDGIHDVPAITTNKTIDTTGAGDAFAFGMVWGLESGREWQEAMQWGVKIAALNITGFGGWWAADPNNPNRITPAFFDPTTT